MSGEKMKTLELTDAAAGAMFDTLSAIAPQGRKEIRTHARLMRMVKSNCSEPVEGKDFTMTSGMVTLGEEDVEYFIKALRVKVGHGVPGRLAEGYEKLLELIDPDGG